MYGTIMSYKFEAVHLNITKLYKKGFDATKIQTNPVSIQCHLIRYLIGLFFAVSDVSEESCRESSFSSKVFQQ